MKHKEWLNDEKLKAKLHAANEKQKKEKRLHAKKKCEEKEKTEFQQRFDSAKAHGKMS